MTCLDSDGNETTEPSGSEFGLTTGCVHKYTSEHCPDNGLADYDAVAEESKCRHVET